MSSSFSYNVDVGAALEQQTIEQANASRWRAFFRTFREARRSGRVSRDVGEQRLRFPLGSQRARAGGAFMSGGRPPAARQQPQFLESQVLRAGRIMEVGG